MGFLPDSDSMPQYDNVFGGRAWVCIESLETLLTEIKECGAELVFFFDGSFDPKNIGGVMGESDEKFEERLKLLRLIKEGNQTVMSVVQDEHKGLLSFKYNSILLSVIRGVCARFGKISLCEKYDCDQEISCFVQNNPRVLGVISNDSDFFIFPGDFKLYSTSSIVFHQKRKTLTVEDSLRQELRNKLKLDELQLAVFATFCGNGYYPYDVMKPLHVKLIIANKGRGGKFGHLLVIAAIVRETFKMTATTSLSMEELSLKFNEMLVAIAGDSKEMLDVITENELIFKERFVLSMMFYLCNKNVELSYDVAPEAFEDHLTYKILNDQWIGIVPTFHDMHDDSLGKFENLFFSRLSRQYAAILKLNSSEKELNFFSLLSNESETAMVELQPEPVPFSVEHLKENPTENERFELLKWLSEIENADNFDIDTFESKYVVDILTMSCMYLNEAITLKELDLLLWTVFAHHQKIIPRCLVVPGDRKIHYRAFCIPHTFGDVHFEVLRSIDICKLRERFWVSWKV